MPGSLRALLLLLPLAAGCDRSPAGPDETLPPDTDFPLAVAALSPSITAGSGILLRFDNNGDVAVGYNLCVDGNLEHRVGSSWVTLFHFPFPCAAQMTQVDPGGSSQTAYGVPTDAPPGIYRVRIRFLSVTAGEGIIRRSNTFEVH